MKAVIEGPDTIKSIVSDVEDSLKSAIKMKDQLPNDLENSNLNAFEKIKVVPNFACNIAILQQGLKKMSRLDEVIQRAMVETKNLVQNFPVMVDEAGEKGKKCYEQGYKKVDDCLLHNIPKERILEDEKKKMEKEDKKKKKKAKKQKKKEKKEAWLKQRGKI